MADQQKILVLTSKTGGGHISLAEALRDQLARIHTIEIIDPQPGFFHWHYRLVSRYALWLWAAEFQFTDTPDRALFAHRLFAPLVARELTELLERVRPALIITTYPFLTYEVMQVLAKSTTSIPFVMLPSDPNGVHASWLSERRATAVLAPTRETYEQACAAGFTTDQLHLVGWPVRAQFYRDYAGQRSMLLTQLGLKPERFTIFLQGGGEGAARFGRTVEGVLAANPDAQVILAVGTNQALLERFTGVERLYALPFTREIAPYMAAADVVMGKAGPNMLFEAVTLGKPFIATAYIPGQEEVNLEFIRRHQLGWVALTPEEQGALLAQLASNPDTLQTMRATVDAYRQWNTAANKSIVEIIEDLL
ncbi:MAG TPA: glycosyltransferase [Ktedonosporobacter sp.]|nr:glycosyltransferase [Ktedonosporobacter sp.]